jgi:hypothetical protein
LKGKFLFSTLHIEKPTAVLSFLKVNKEEIKYINAKIKTHKILWPSEPL